MKKGSRRYCAKPNTAFNDEDAKIIGRFLDDNFPDHQYTPDEIVRLATDPHSPIHRYFEWDEASAAHKYRLVQARRMVNCVVEIIDDIPVPKAVSVVVEVSNGELGRTYMDTEKARHIKSAWEQVLKEALDHIKAWRDRYAKFKELGAIFEAIDKTIEEVEQWQRKQQPKRSRKSPKARRTKRK